jgi:SiaC family regulatory phosphoprotein
MNTLFIAGTDDTPEVTFNKESGIFEIKGRSLPEDVIEFYSRVFSWLEQYVSNPNEESIFKVRVDYFNSASQRALNEIFTILSRINIKGKKILVEWHYHVDDDEMLESGREYSEITNLSFQFKSFM